MIALLLALASGSTLILLGAWPLGRRASAAGLQHAFSICLILLGGGILAQSVARWLA